jgi:transposase
MAIIRYAERNGTRRQWLVELMVRRTTKVAALTAGQQDRQDGLGMMTNGERYREPIIA